MIKTKRDLEDFCSNYKTDGKVDWILHAAMFNKTTLKYLNKKRHYIIFSTTCQREAYLGLVGTEHGLTSMGAEGLRIGTVPFSN